MNSIHRITINQNNLDKIIPRKGSESSRNIRMNNDEKEEENGSGPNIYNSAISLSGDGSSGASEINVDTNIGQQVYFRTSTNLCLIKLL